MTTQRLPKPHPTASAAEVRPVFLGLPSTITLPNNSPAGTIVASGFLVNSDGSAFTGTVMITDEAGNPAPLTIQSDRTPLTLGNAAACRARLIARCLDCQRQAKFDPTDMAERFGADTTVPDWHARLVCSECGRRRIDIVVTGTKPSS